MGLTDSERSDLSDWGNNYPRRGGGGSELTALVAELGELDRITQNH